MILCVNRITTSGGFFFGNTKFNWLLCLSCVIVVFVYSLNCVRLLWPPELYPARLLCPWDFPGKNTGVSCHFLLHGFFPTQGLKPPFLHCRQILYHWAWFFSTGSTYLYNQFSSVAESYLTLWPHGLQHAGLPCPSPTPGAHSNYVHQVGDASHHLIFCCPLLLPSVFSKIRVFSNKSAPMHQVAKVLEFQLQHQSFQWIFRVDFPLDWLVWSPCSPRNSLKSSPATIWKHQFFGAQPSLWSNSHIHTWLLEKP